MVKIEKLNHSSFLIKGEEKNIIIDPYNIESKSKGDIILITHPHFDHYSPQDIKRVKKKNSIIVMPPMINSKKIAGNPIKVRPWSELNIGDIWIRAIPSYNLEKNYHPKNSGWLGYVIHIDNKKIYHAGDTDLIEEMKSLGEINYAMLPVSGKYTMNAKDAAKAVKMINPELAIPMHYGELMGGINNADEFHKICSCKVKINSN